MAAEILPNWSQVELMPFVNGLQQHLLLQNHHVTFWKFATPPRDITLAGQASYNSNDWIAALIAQIWPQLWVSPNSFFESAVVSPPSKLKAGDYPDFDDCLARMTVQEMIEGREDTFTQGQGFIQSSDAVIDVKSKHGKELARARKEKQRKKIRKTEIAREERSPGGMRKESSKIGHPSDFKGLSLRLVVLIGRPLDMFAMYGASHLVTATFVQGIVLTQKK
ncbi:hypothetical protein B0H13DRAFT_1884853 [Mycena leptocephala]|nr:hypothetical protein B0H13DRAFT_1884853 [Mycena leptocephala]